MKADKNTQVEPMNDVQDVSTDVASEAPHCESAKHTLEADAIINKDMLLAMGVGIVPIPLVDFVGVTAVQLRMLRRIAELYEIPYSKKDTQALVSALLGGALPAAAALPVASLMRWIPVVGWTLGSASMSILSGASTYALGQVFARHFAKGGTIQSFNVGAAKDEFLALMSFGKQKATKMKDKPTPASTPTPTPTMP